MARPRKPVRKIRPSGPGRPADRRSVASSVPPERLVFGHHAVGEAWLNPERHCQRLLVTQVAFDALGDAFERAARLKLQRPAPEIVDRETLDAIVAGNHVHQGALLVADPLEEADLDDIGRLAADRERAVLVMLDQVTDPQNVGAILRSAAAFGALALVVTDRHAPDLTGTLTKIASGAVEHVPVVRVTNLARALRDLQGWGFWCVGLAEEAEKTLAELDPPAKLALVMGAEGPGLRRLTRETCDALARLPTSGPIASLNVSNAAAAALYEFARTRS